MVPEEKVARRFSEKRGIKPPVDVEALVSDAADVEEDSLPVGYDACFLDRSAKYPRPRVILNIGQSRARRVFTLAHELGHLVIPWHFGTHFCQVDGEARLVDDLTREVESQANRFAGEVLMPEAWVKQLITSVAGLENLVEGVKSAGVSYLAASIRLIKILGSGFTFVEVDSQNLVVRALASPQTWIPLPQVGSRLAKDQINSLAEEKASFTSSSSRILWWRLSEKIAPPEVAFGTETSSELISRICLEVLHDQARAKKAIMTINGVIGAANGANRIDCDQDLFTVLKHRFLGRREIAAVIAHKSFDHFLARRAEELMRKGSRPVVPRAGETAE